jgi:hypothetical protein
MRFCGARRGTDGSGVPPKAPQRSIRAAANCWNAEARQAAWAQAKLSNAGAAVTRFGGDRGTRAVYRTHPETRDSVPIGEKTCIAVEFGSRR